MKKVKFEVTIMVEGVSRNAGSVVDVEEIPSGNLESLMRLGQVTEVPEEPIPSPGPGPLPPIRKEKPPMLKTSAKK
jgi:hypothetical protein